MQFPVCFQTLTLKSESTDFERGSIRKRKKKVFQSLVDFQLLVLCKTSHIEHNKDKEMIKIIIGITDLAVSFCFMLRYEYSLKLPNKVHKSAEHLKRPNDQYTKYSCYYHRYKNLNVYSSLTN